MVKSSRSPALRPDARGPWFDIGQRLRNRRIQLGYRKGALAAHLGVSMARFEEMEAGLVEMSPPLVTRLADLLKIPAVYFYEDMPSGPDVARSAPSGPPTASDEECLEGLISAFRALDRGKQQYLLALALALAQDAETERALPPGKGTTQGQA